MGSQYAGIRGFASIQTLATLVGGVGANQTKASHPVDRQTYYPDTTALFPQLADAILVDDLPCCHLPTSYNACNAATALDLAG
ncbi:hypothetical protein O9K51_01785 [Purpureocillium lavendulum]|uniref:Uncharacterized protein n=1 Tax=Purpureocillium lavendulum TaxID=1247861 RepID=A0AB34G5W6_9HYPO|nr:hypothetical protein O9K51_01785 [Purpureocillium lavendulum]